MRPWMVKESGFGQRMHPDDRELFMQVCPDVRYRKGDTIFRTGDPATDMHVVAQGRVKLTAPTATGHERILALCGPDDFIGEAFLHADATYRVDAVALTDVTTCPMNREQFERLARQSPSFALSFAETLATHLFDCRAHMETAYDPIKTRVAKTLLDLGERFGAPDPDDPDWITLDTHLKHDEIASITSSTRVSVTMAFTELRNAGLVEGSRGRYRIHGPALTSFAESPD